MEVAHRWRRDLRGAGGSAWPPGARRVRVVPGQSSSPCPPSSVLRSAQMAGSWAGCVEALGKCLRGDHLIEPRVRAVFETFDINHDGHLHTVECVERSLHPPRNSLGPDLICSSSFPLPRRLTVALRALGLNVGIKQAERVRDVATFHRPPPSSCHQPSRTHIPFLLLPCRFDHTQALKQYDLDNSSTLQLHEFAKLATAVGSLADFDSVAARTSPQSVIGASNLRHRRHTEPAPPPATGVIFVTKTKDGTRRSTAAPRGVATSTACPPWVTASRASRARCASLLLDTLGTLSVVSHTLASRALSARIAAPAGTVLIGRGTAAEKYSATPIPTETDLSEDSYPGSHNTTPQQVRTSMWRLTSSSSSSSGSRGSPHSPNSPKPHSPPVRRLSVFLKTGRTGFTPRVEVDNTRSARQGEHRRSTVGGLLRRAATQSLHLSAS